MRPNSFFSTTDNTLSPQRHHLSAPKQPNTKVGVKTLPSRRGRGGTENLYFPGSYLLCNL